VEWLKWPKPTSSRRDTLPTLASDKRQPAQQALNVPNRVFLGDGWHSTYRGNPRAPHPGKQSRLPTVPSLVYALSYGIGIPAWTAGSRALLHRGLLACGWGYHLMHVSVWVELREHGGRKIRTFPIGNSSAKRYFETLMPLMRQPGRIIVQAISLQVARKSSIRSISSYNVRPTTFLRIGKATLSRKKPRTFGRSRPDKPALTTTTL